MTYQNNHYVPQLILRRFGNKINRFNLETKEVRIKGSTKSAFFVKNLYPEWLELMLGDFESRIAYFIDTKILNAEKTITLKRAEAFMIKKFFTIEMLRVPESTLYYAKNCEKEEDLKKQGFVEVHIENETNDEYGYRTLKVILESNSVEDVYNHKEVTYEACKWIQLFNNCYITVWDSSNSKEDFIITDNGMNCEHDKSRFRPFNFNGQTYYNQKYEMIKQGYIQKKIEENKNSRNKIYAYATILERMHYVHANYYLFAVSNTRTVALVNPFYRLYDDQSFIMLIGEKPNIWPTLLSKEALSSNKSQPKNHYMISDDDLYQYTIKDLPLRDVIIVNNMMLDRVHHLMGYNESSKIIRSLSIYSLLPKGHRRKDYGKLMEYLQSLGYTFPKNEDLQSIANDLLQPPITNEEMEYVKYFYNLINQN